MRPKQKPPDAQVSAGGGWSPVGSRLSVDAQVRHIS